MSNSDRKISFPVDSVVSAIIQDGDTQELWKILTENRGDFDINQENHVGLTALHHAVLSNNIDSVKMLLTEGSDTNVQDVHGFSPLHTAAACGFLHISSLLIVFGADVFLQTKQKELPIDVAKDLPMCRLLAEEMYSIIHRELYCYSIITSKLWSFWRFILRIFSYLYQWILSRKSSNLKEDNVSSRGQESSQIMSVNHKSSTKKTHRYVKLD